MAVTSWSQMSQSHVIQSYDIREREGCRTNNIIQYNTSMLAL